MDMCFIVRKAEELEGRGQEILKFAFSLEYVEAILGNLGERDRLYDPVTTWLIFLGQTLSPDHSCRNAIAQARAAGRLARKASVHTGAYCQARDRLEEHAVRILATGLGEALMESETCEERWHGRRVLVPDGSSVSLPDTPANQDAYPQPSTQAPGCGFPVMYLCGLMSLASGALLDFEPGAGNGNELPLWRRLWHYLRPGDVILGDGKYSSYADIALLHAKDIDVVARPGNRKIDFRAGKVSCTWDHIVEWKRPKKPPEWLGDEILPETIRIRELCFRVDVPGFRPEIITLVTTLLDGEEYPVEEIAQLFFGRWQVELRLRDIKTVLGMDVLRTKTPVRARKELWMYLAAYNLLRTLMLTAAREVRTPVPRISFQGTRQRFLAAADCHSTPPRFVRIYTNLIHDIAQDLNTYRPFRVEPRAIKRRKKQYDLLSQPRAVLQQKLRKVA
jgi:hypothetical protein